METKVIHIAKIDALIEMKLCYNTKYVKVSYPINFLSEYSLLFELRDSGAANPKKVLEKMIPL